MCKRRVAINLSSLFILATGLVALSCGNSGNIRGTDWFVFVGGASVVEVDGFGNFWVANLGPRGSVSKYDNEGNNLLYLKVGRGTSVLRGIEIDGAANLYMVGSSHNLCTGSSGGQERCGEVVVKYDSEGNKLWTHHLLRRHPSPVFTAVAVDSSGNVYVVGTTPVALPGQTNFGGWDAFVRKLDSDGGELWTRQFGGIFSDGASSVAVFDSHSIYIAGQTKFVLTDENTLEEGKATVFVRKYDGDGNELWTRQPSSLGYLAPSNIEVDGAGNVFIFGSMMHKFGNDGRILWTRRSNSTQSFSVDVLGNVYLAGTKSKMAYVRKLDSDGQEVWFQQIDAADSDVTKGDYNRSSAQDVAIDGSGNVYVVGSATYALPKTFIKGETHITIRGFLAKLKVP